MSTTTTLTAPAVPGPPGQPDISYVPDPEKWRARAEKRIKAGGLPTTVPDGFPEQLTGDLVWEGDSVANEYDWTFVLSDHHLDEIDNAVKHFKCKNPIVLNPFTGESLTRRSSQLANWAHQR